VGEGPFEVGPHWLDRVEFVRVRRELVNREPVPGGDQPGQVSSRQAATRASSRSAARRGTCTLQPIRCSSRSIPVTGPRLD
jgi:hypothetical protein